MSTTAPFLQLDAICDMVATAIRGNVELADAFGVTGKQLCKAVLQRKAFDAKDDSAAIYATEMPCLAIFPKKSQRHFVRGNNGMLTTLGIQYLFKQPVGADMLQSMERVNRALHMLWWVICDALQAPNAVTVALLVDSVGADETDYLGPLDDGTCGLDGTGEMTYSMPPYAAKEAVNLETIHGDYILNRLYGDVGTTPTVDPLMESTTDDLTT
jgi:hypothetical protein